MKPLTNTIKLNFGSDFADNGNKNLVKNKL